MTKPIIAKILVALLMPIMCFANDTIDSLRNQLIKSQHINTPAAIIKRVNTLNKLGDAYKYNLSDSSVYFYKQSIQLADKHNYFEGKATGLYLLGSVHYVIGNYFESLELATQLAQLSNQRKYPKGIANAYHLSGLIYLSQDELDDAIADFRKSLKVSVALRDSKKLVKIYFNLGICYDEMHKPKKAFEYLDKAMQIAKKVSDVRMISMIHNRMGEAYFRIGDNQNALFYHRQVLNAKYGDNWENAFAYSGIAQAQYALKQYDIAITNAQKSVEYARLSGSLWDEVRALTILSKAEAKAGNYKSAYNTITLRNQLNDSLTNDNRQKKINYLQLKQQRSDNLQLAKENEIHEQKSDFNRLLIIGIGLLAVCISIFAIVISRSNVHKTSLNKKLERRNRSIALQKDEITRQNEKLDKLNQTKNQLFSVISHDLRGPFASMQQTVELIRQGDIDEQEREIIFDRFYRQLSQVTGMVNNLLIWANSQLAGITSKAVNTDVTEIAEETIAVSGFLAADKNIQIIHNKRNGKQAFADPDHVRIILQNIIGNAIKFTPKGGSITIDYPENNRYTVIRVTDTGTGITPEKMHRLFTTVGKGISSYGTNNETGAGIGLLLIKQFADVNNGEIKIHSQPDKGTEVELYLPVQKN